MAHHMIAQAVLLTTSLLFPLVSNAQEPTLQQLQPTSQTDPLSNPWSPALGVRLGGYGFRQLNADNRQDWGSCRMDGAGIFGTLSLTNHLYAEMSTDLYFATNKTLQSGIDRISMHTVAALGARFAPDFIISPLIQLGVGAEYTWVEVFGERDQSLLPVGFIGAGGELNLSNFHLGITARFNAMQLPSYASNPTSAEPLDYNTQVAGQMLFSVRYTL